jgi:hypothetical protein
MPRSVPKIAIFEEAARTLDIPGGTKTIQEYGVDSYFTKLGNWIWSAKDCPTNMARKARLGSRKKLPLLYQNALKPSCET